MRRSLSFLARIGFVAWGLLGSLAGCGLGSSVDGGVRFACTADEECAPGYRCEEGFCAASAPGALAVHPSVATAGREVWLEGLSGERVEVRFPGGAAVEGVGEGGARLALPVPVGAGRGPLRLSVDGVEGSGPWFSRPGYAVALSAVRGEHAQGTVARGPSRLRVPRRDAVAVVTGGRLYAIGGAGAEGAIAGVESAPIFADGALGAFVEDDVTLVTARAGAASARAGGFVYVAGGEGEGGPLGSVERARVLGRGLGDFERLDDSPLDRPRARAAAAIVGRWLYVVGGRDDTGPLSSVTRAEVRADGSLGGFTEVPASLVNAREGHRALVVGRRLYVIGGEVEGAPTASVEVAEIDEDGGLGAFAEATGVALVEPRRGATAVMVDDDVYVLGAGTFERAPFDADGLGPFERSPLPGPSFDHAIATALGDDFLYVVGGDREGAPSDAVVRASFRDGAAVPEVFVEGPALPRGQTYPSVAVIGPWLYVIGGNRRDDESTPAIHRARVRPDGNLGVFEPAGMLDAPRAYACTAVIDGWLYLVGGATTGVVPVADVLRAPILDEGGLGPFEDAGTSLRTPRHAASCAVIGDRLWVFGGSGLDTLESAPVLEGGALGAFVAEPRRLQRRRAFASSVVLDDRLVLAGGNVDGAVLDTYEVAEIDDEGNLGAFTLGSLPSPLCCSGAAVVGSRVFFFSGQTSGEGGQLEGAQVADFTSPSLRFEEVALDLVNPRRGHRAVVLGDRVHLIGGWDNDDDQLAVESAPLP